MKLNFLSTISLTLIMLSCNQNDAGNSTNDTEISFQNKGHELIHKMTEATGTYEDLLSKENVTYTYTYTTPDGLTDISSEKYIFDDELSYGKYHRHERTLPDLAGIIEQGYDGTEYWLKVNGELSDNEEALKKVRFNRPTNFYWFTMMQKLMDPGLNYEYIGEKRINNVNYDIVKISFQSNDTLPTDIYQVYINQSTHLVDQFLFTVVDYNVIENPFIMLLEYEEVDGIQIPTKRKYKKSNWDAEISNDPWINVTWTNIKFNTSIVKEDFKKENNMQDQSTPLKDKLEEKKANFEANADEHKKQVYKEGIAAVDQTGITSSALQVGDKAPDFVLRNALGEPVSLYDYLEKGKVVLTWYRGGWCPYCNLTLHQLQEELPNFKANNANLLALTPELPDSSMTTAEKNNLEFEVLSDVDNQIAKQYGIVFKLTDEVAEMYNASFNLKAYNGNTSNELPLAATYIIEQDGTITYAFLDADYRNRAEPAEITSFLMSNK